MSAAPRQPDRIQHVYELTNGDLHAAVRAYLDIPQEIVTSIIWNAYGCTADAEVTLRVKG